MFPVFSYAMPFSVTKEPVRPSAIRHRTLPFQKLCRSMPIRMIISVSYCCVFRCEFACVLFQPLVVFAMMLKCRRTATRATNLCLGWRAREIVPQPLLQPSRTKSFDVVLTQIYQMSAYPTKTYAFCQAVSRSMAVCHSSNRCASARRRPR